MNASPVSLPVGPEIVRVFCGYKLPSLDRDAFYRHLGETFMPGTPYMQAPLGLNAYLPAVLDPDEGSGLPDEVALIVYASRSTYDHAREHSLRRRVYTHAHAAVFDMAARGGGGQFPGRASDPSERDDRKAWYLRDQRVDWQEGSTRLLFFSAASVADGLREQFIERSVKADIELESAGVDQLVGVATNNFAAVWLHSPERVEPPTNLFGLKPDGAELMRELTAEPVPMPNLEEGVEISGPSMFTFRFVRELRFHL